MAENAYYRDNLEDLLKFFNGKSDCVMISNVSVCSNIKGG